MSSRMPKPAPMTTADLRANLTQMVEGWRMLKAPPGAWAREAFTLAMGRDFIAQRLPRGLRRGTPKECFSNAGKLVLNRPDLNLTYCEGFVAAPRVPLSIHHGWAIDAEGRVVDPTLRDPELCAYVGVPIPLEDFIASIAQTETWGIFTDRIGCIRWDWLTERCPALKEMAGEGVDR